MTTKHARNGLASGALLLAALGLSSGCGETSTGAQADGNPPRGPSTVSTRSVRGGTTIQVALGGDISSRRARVGDAWSGTVTQNVMNRDENVIPPGSLVDGVVTAVLPARRGSPAMLTLAIRGIRVDGHDEPIAASSEPVIAGSTRARHLGAITGGAAAGSPHGRNAVDGGNSADGGSAVAAAGVIAVPDGDQVVLCDGMVMSFTVNQTVAMR